MKRLLNKNQLAIITMDYAVRKNIGNFHFNEALAKRFDRVHYFFMESGYFNPRDHKDYFKNCDMIFINRPLRKLHHKSIEGEVYRSLNFKNSDAVIVLYDTDTSALDIEFRCQSVAKLGVDYLALGNNDYRVKDHQIRLGRDVDCFYLPFGVNISYFKDLMKRRNLNVGFSGNTNLNYYPKRKDMIAHFSSRFSDFHKSNVSGGKYVDFLNRLKVFVVANDTKSGFFMKHLESMACGCLLVAEHTPLFSKLGFRHKKHLITWTSLQDAENHVVNYLNNTKFRLGITARGKKLVHEKHTWDHRVETLLERVTNGQN